MQHFYNIFIFIEDFFSQTGLFHLMTGPLLASSLKSNQNLRQKCRFQNTGKFQHLRRWNEIQNTWLSSDFDWQKFEIHSGCWEIVRSNIGNIHFLSVWKALQCYIIYDHQAVKEVANITGSPTRIWGFLVLNSQQSIDKE